MGKNTLATMIKKMCDNAGTSGGHTNHSLRVYGTTTLFHTGVPEKLIQQRTGHRSLEALCQYEHTLESQQLDISNAMAHGDKVPSINTKVKEEMSHANQPSRSGSQHRPQLLRLVRYCHKVFKVELEYPQETLGIPCYSPLHTEAWYAIVLTYDSLGNLT